MSDKDAAKLHWLSAVGVGWFLGNRNYLVVALFLALAILTYRAAARVLGASVTKWYSDAR